MAPAKAGALLARKKKIMVLTGAGISAPSGIPTYRGDNGLWTRGFKEGVSDPKQLATAAHFKKHPASVWRYTRELLELVRKSRPNAAHLAVQELLE